MKLAARITCGLCIAVGSLFALQRLLRSSDARAAARAEPPPTVLAQEHRLPPVHLEAAAGRILLVGRPESVPRTAAPVVQVLADGGHAIRRPAPLPAGPVVEPAACPAIVLPGQDLRRLDPRARATFAEVIARLVVERPVPADRFVTVDLAVPLADLEAVLRWVP